MADGTYTVKINANDGAVEIEGDDKEWVAAQLDKLVPIFSGSTARPRRSPEHETVTAPRSKGDNGSEKGGSGRARRAGNSRATRNPDLEALLTKEVQRNLEEWRNVREPNWKRTSNQLAIIATFLQDNLDWPRTDASDFYTVYSVMGWPSPGNPRSAITNARDRDKYFGGQVDGKSGLTHKGENFGRHGSVPSKDPDAGD